MKSNISESTATYKCHNETVTIVFGSLNTREYLLVVAYSMILLCGVLGNALVIYIFGYKKKSQQTLSTEKLIFYLAVIDFFASLFNPVQFIYLTITRYKQWHFGYVGCKIIPAFGPITTTASAGMLLLFAVDRYRAIVFPFQGELAPKSINITTSLVITISVLTNIHYMYALKITDNFGCRVPHAENILYGMPNCVFIVLRLSIYLLVFTYTHLGIYLALQRGNRCFSLDQGLVIKRECQSKRIIRCVFIMGLVFLLLVFPREALYLIYNLSWLTSTCGIKFTLEIVLANSFLKVLKTANSCANVFIYSHMHVYYRKQVLKVIRSFGVSSTRLFQMIYSHLWHNLEHGQDVVTTRIKLHESNIPEEHMDKNELLLRENKIQANFAC